VEEVKEPEHPVQAEFVGPVGRSSRIDGRLGELALLADGWLGPGEDSLKPAAVAVEAARLLAHRLEAAGVHSRIYPTPEGGIQLEWKTGNRASSMEIGNSLEVYSLIVDTETGADEELTLPDVDEDRLMRFLTGGA